MSSIQRLSGFFEERLPIRALVRRASRKLFPSHWSFLLGEIALFSFVALVATGIYLALFYRPSIAPTVYEGSYRPMTGWAMPEAFVSVLRLSLDVPFGLVVRRLHHFAAHLFIASLLLHAARVYFTGAFRRPREITWWLGLAMFAVALVNGFSGYSLPFDMRGGTAIRMLLTTLESIPWAGEWLATLVFGTTFPGPLILGRLYLEHILIGPVLIAALLTAHLYLVVRFTHTDFPGVGRSDRTEVGGPAWPDQAARSTSLAFLVWASLAMLSAFFPVEAVWEYGPFQAFSSYMPLDPDWYLFWIEGAFRLIPGTLDFHLLGANFTGPFYGTLVLSGWVFGGCFVYPLVDQRMYDACREDHHLLERVWERPFRTAFGLSGIVFLVLLSTGALNERIADGWTIPIEELNVGWRALTVGVPPFVFVTSFLSLRAIRKRAEGARDLSSSVVGVAAALVAVIAVGTLVRERLRLWLERPRPRP